MNREVAIDDLKDHDWDTNDDKKTCIDILNEVFDYFEEQIQGLQSLLDLKQQEISVLQSKVVEVKTCEGCKYEVAGGYDCSHWTAKHEDCCIRFNDPVDYYEPKQN